LDLLFLFLLLVQSAGFCYIIYRLYQRRTVATLALAAGQIAVAAFLIFSYNQGVYREPFVIFTAFVVGVSAPFTLFYLDVAALRKKIKDRFGISLTCFLYQNDHDELLKNNVKTKYVDDVLQPRAESIQADDVMGEIRVERADTSKNIQRQLEAASKKYDEEDYAGAYSAYQIIEKVFNRSPSLYMNIGNVEYDRGDFEAAAKNYARGIECAGHKDFEHDDMSEILGNLYYNLGNACFLSQKYARAIEAYKSARELLKDYSNALFNLSFCHAMDFEETGDTDKAIDAFIRLVEDMPGNVHAWFQYGKCLLKINNIPQAIECFKKVVGEDITFYEAWYYLAIAYDESGMVNDAVRAYYTSIQIKKDFVDAYNNLGVLLSITGRHGEALKVLKTAIRIKPGDTELIYNIGLTQYALGRHEEALDEFLACEKLRPDDGSVFYMISLVYMHLGKPQESLEYLEKAIAKEPSLSIRASKESVFKQYIESGEHGRLFAQ